MPRDLVRTARSVVLAALAVVALAVPAYAQLALGDALPMGDVKMKNVNGKPVPNALAGGGGSSLIYDTVNLDEIAITVARGQGESDRGGPALNIKPRSGGNTLQGQAITNF